MSAELAYITANDPEVCAQDHTHGCPCAAGGDAIRLSMLRCSECGDLLDFDGRCVIHGLLDPEADCGD